jgi:hypothetical protein
VSIAFSKIFRDLLCFLLGKTASIFISALEMQARGLSEATANTTRLHSATIQIYN